MVDSLVMLVVVLFLTGTFGYRLITGEERSKRRAAAIQMKFISNAIELFRRKHAALPTSLEDLGIAGKDPWGSDYVYLPADDRYDLLSYGPDRIPASGDDILSTSPVTP